MTRRGLALGRQLATFAALAVLALSLSGDRTSAAGVPATVYGQDPLEVLELKVRPNVIIVLDSSGSMNWGVSAPATPSPNNLFYPPEGGDHPRSKIYQAKQVLKQIVANNQDNVSFMLAHYDQNTDVLMQNTGAATLASGNAHRFQYWTSTTLSPSMATTELGIMNDRNSTAGRGLQSWQLIFPQRGTVSGWNTFYYAEGGATCVATLSLGPGPEGEKFYSQGGKANATDADVAGSLAADLAAAMNNPTGCTRQNTYDVTYTAATGVFTFVREVGSVDWRPIWTTGANNIRGALRGPTSDPLAGAGPFSTRTPYTLLYRPNNATASNTLAVGAPYAAMNYKFDETIDGTTVTNYNLLAARFWNGEVIDVVATGASAGQVCDVTFPTTAQRTNPPTITVRGVPSCGGAPTSTVAFTWAGPFYNGSTPCQGMVTRVNLIPCDLQMPPAPAQVDTIHPWLNNEFPLDSTGMPEATPRDLSQPAPATTTGYSEAQNGTWAGTQPGYWAGGIKAMGGTPVTPSIQGVDAVFTTLWNTGQAAGSPAPPYEIKPISDSTDPKEKTILLFVTDGMGNCPTAGDSGALGAARAARDLYQPVEGGCKDPDDGLTTTTPICADVDGDGISGLAEPGSSVQTYMIGYGDAVNLPDDIDRLNWIAWGGSGLYNAFTNAGSHAATNTALVTAKAKCTTCQDAFIAPTAGALASQIQGIIDQGASDGEFTAQQSITESVFEYVDRVPGSDARSPSSRYTAIVPTRFVSSFTLPGFRGQLKAYQNDGTGGSVQKWSAGDLLKLQVETAMLTCTVANECDMGELQAKIKRRIYTTTRNGVYDFDPGTLMAGTSAQRTTLWPPAAGVLKTDYSPGLFDAAMGLPPDTPTAFPPNSPDKYCDPAKPDLPKKSPDLCWLETFQRDYRACLGSYPPLECGSTQPVNTRMRAARREARDIIVAFLAGAATVPDGAGIKRTSAAKIVYKARPWILADSEMATAAVVAPPSLSEPEATPYVAEYKLFRDGTRGAAGKNVDPAGSQIRQGFGLTQPDDDQTVASGDNDTRTAVKPVMTVVYAPANDMLHAFRAGPCYSPSTTPASCLGGPAESGGEELWGFVPYDQLEAVRLRAANEPQGRANHVYMLGRGIRFADVFVPGAMTNVSIGNVPVASMQGVWRRVLYFGRGIGGKYVTALDVTAPGPYTASALSTVAPIPLWSRGNPDTQDGLASGVRNGSSTDADAYARMGETWSMPTVVYTNSDKTNPLYVTTRRPDGIDFAIFMGSGYGNPNAAVREGTTHYTLDALSGDVIAAVDVEDVAASYGLTRSGLSYPNAIVANSVSFNRSAFMSISAKQFNVNPHPWSFVSTRVYVGDLHGRLWKFLSAYPNVALPAADLGEDQPVGTAVALMGEDVDPLVPNPATMIPNIFVSTGAERRAEGPFRSYSLIDTGVDTAPTTTGTEVGTGPAAGVTTFLPVRPQFVEEFDQGVPEADCGYTTESVFRGTIQPTSVVECDGPLQGSRCTGELLQRVFFGGTRLSLPNTKYAPPTPLACGTGDYPCRSQFDSILYALGVKSGQAAYDLNASGDDAYRIFRDSRIAGISFQADPDTSRGGSRFVADEGLMKGTPKPPPIPGVPPTATTATANVVLRREPGKPAPAVQYGSTVCQ